MRERTPITNGWKAVAVAVALGFASCTPGGPLPYAGFLDAPVAAVASQVAGRVDAIVVREGDLVKKDQLLARLDSREREAAVAQAQATLDQAREALKEAEANLGATVPTVTGARADIAQAQATLDDAELTSANARMLEARARLESLGAARAATAGRVTASAAGVANAKAAVSTAEAALQVAKVQLAEAEVLCPFDGRVVQRNLQPGEWAAPGTPVVTVEDLSQLWVRLDIEESRLEGIAIGQPAEVRVIADPKSEYAGRVTQIGAEGDFAVNRDVKRGRPDIRTFLVRVAIDQAAPSLRPGMTAEVTFPPGAAARPPQDRAER